MWAHAEYLKLLRSAVDGKVFDRIDTVYERYCKPRAESNCVHNLEVYSCRRPIQKITAGDTLRILTTNAIRGGLVVRQLENYANHTEPRAWAALGYSADLSTAPDDGEGGYHGLFTGRSRHRWLGYNVDIKIEPE